MIRFFVFLLLVFPLFSFASLIVSSETTSSWEQWFCQELVIRNTWLQVIDWWTIRIRSYRLSSMYTKRSAEWFQDGNDIVVRPVDRNRRLDPSQSWRVGYCVQDWSRRVINADLSVVAWVTSMPTNSTSPTNPSNPTPSSPSTTSSTGGVVLRFPTDGERPTSKYDANSDGRVDMIFANNHWNVRSTQGEAVMHYDPRRQIVSYQHNLRSIAQKDSGGWVHGYPEVFVGRKPRWGDTTNGWTDLPRRVSDLSSLLFSTDFSITNTSWWPLNMAVEWWLVTDPMRADSVRGQEIEFMVKLFKDNIGAAWFKVDTITHLVVIDGVETQVGFELFKSTWGRDFFTYIPDRTLDGKTILIDLKPLLDRLSRHIPYSIANHYFMNREMGTEYGSPHTPNSQISWEIRRFCLSVNGGVQWWFGCSRGGSVSSTWALVTGSTQQTWSTMPPLLSSWTARDEQVIQSVLVKLDTMRVLQGEDVYNRVLSSLQKRAHIHSNLRIRRLITEILRRVEIDNS